jgi:beta-lactamase class A/beta-lactamase class A VEB
MNYKKNRITSKQYNNLMKYALLPLFFPLFLHNLVGAQSLENLRNEIESIIESKNAIVGIDFIGIEETDTLSYNEKKHFPMQSVFKFHIAVVMLSEIDKGRFYLNQKINIRKNELLPGLYSPLRDKYPNGAKLSIKEILEYTVSRSDNVGCDVLLKLLGGPNKVEEYFIEKGFTDISIKINEETMQGNWDMQFQNWTTPKSANRVLKAFYDNENKLLTTESHKVLWDLMQYTTTGSKRLKGQLPKGTVVAHKTGWSGANNEGITAAVNNIGVIFLPNGEHFFISVFVTNSKENLEANEAIISSIGKAIWDFYVKN